MITIENLKRLADNVKAKFVSIKQGKENYGKILAVNEDGNIETMSAPESMDVSYNEEEKRLVVSSKTNLPGNVSVDSSLSVSGNAADAKVVGDTINKITKELEEDINQLSEEIEDLKQNGTGSGLTLAQANALDGLFKKGAYKEDVTEEYNAFRSAFFSGIVAVTGVSLSKSSENVYTGYSTTVTATVEPSSATDKSLIWESSNESVATIDGTGETVTINCIADGSSVIKVTTLDGGFIDTFTVTVATAKVTGITLSNTTGDLVVGDTFELTANITPVEATNKKVTWTTSNDAIATVTPSADTLTATVTAIAEGTATITATTNESGKTATFTATVNSVELVEITPTLLVKSGTDMLNYAYTFDDYESVDTTDTSKIKQYNHWRWLHFDCSNVRKIRIKRYINTLTYGGIGKPLYSYNNTPNIAQKWISDPSTSTTGDVCVPFPAGFNGSAYLSPKPNVGDVVTVGDFELEEGYKHLVIQSPRNMSTKESSTNVEDFKNEDGYWLTSSDADFIKIFIVE